MIHFIREAVPKCFRYSLSFCWSFGREIALSLKLPYFVASQSDYERQDVETRIDKSMWKNFQISVSWEMKQGREHK